MVISTIVFVSTRIDMVSTRKMRGTQCAAGGISHDRHEPPSQRARFNASTEAEKVSGVGLIQSSPASKRREHGAVEIRGR